MRTLGAEVAAFLPAEDAGFLLTVAFGEPLSPSDDTLAALAPRLGDARVAVSGESSAARLRPAIGVVVVS